MNRALVVGVMGGGSAAQGDLAAAFRLGQLIAENGWVLLNGGRNSGVMDASARGARSRGGLTVGILPDDNLHRASPHIDIPILTGMGSARNCINVLSSDVVVACPGGAGTLSEIALAMKHGRPVILLNYEPNPIFESHARDGRLFYAKTPEEVVERIQRGTQAV